MRSLLLALACAWFAAGCTGKNEYVCSALCKDSTGAVVRGASYKIEASSPSDAVAECESRANGTTDCPSGYTVVSACSCFEGGD